MKTNLAVSVLVLAVVTICAHAQGKDYFVAQKDPAADDKNAGTEAKPFKTIQAAVDIVQAGDTIWVKQGVYEEEVRPRSSGNADEPITLSAWKYEHVTLGSVLRDLPPEAKWKPIEKSKSWSMQLTADAPAKTVVIIDGKPIVTEFKDAPPLDANAMWATYRPSDRTLMVNVGGEDPAKGHRIQLARNLYAIYLNEKCSGWAFKKMEFAWAHQGIGLEGNCDLVEDCYFHDVFFCGVFYRGGLSTIRRCSFVRCPGAVLGQGSAAAVIIEDCLVVQCGAKKEDMISERPQPNGEGHDAVEFKSGRLHIFRYNVVADNTSSGLWYDCHMIGARLIGNAFWNNKGYGFYNEYGTNDSLVIGNYFLNNYKAIASSWSTRLSVLDNFFEGTGVVWSCHDRWPFRNSFMTARGNAMVDLSEPYLMTYGPGWGPSLYPENFRHSLVDFNHVRVRPGVPFIDDGGTKVRTVEEIHSKYGWEIHGDIGVYNKDKNDLTPESLGGGKVTFRVPWGPNSHLARPMLSDPGINGKWPCTPEMSNNVSTSSFFWRVGDGNYSANILGDLDFPFNNPWYFNDQYWQQSGGDPLAGDDGQNRGCQWYIDADRDFGKDADGKPIKVEGIQSIGELSLGNRWLVMKGVKPESIPAQGIGYWTPCLPTIEGAKMTVSLKMRGKNIVPSEKGAPAVFLQFTGPTGQDRKRVYLVGTEPGDKPVRPELTKGTYDWTEIKQVIETPKGAIRMALFMGVLPCKGEVDFDDINLTTESASAPAAKQEILPPNLPLQRIKEAFAIDISKAANRALADDEDNDGKGGWTDQGAAADMRKFATGKRDFGGISFSILPPPKSIVVLKSDSRKHDTDLPEKVTIPVGRKVDTLFFLHACAWTPEGGKEAFRYVLHYKDGKDVTIPVIVGQRITDWAASPVRKFPGEEKSFTTVADTVPNPRFGQGSVYRMEWGCPIDRRSVELESIEFIGNGTSVPVLLGITGVMEW